MAELFRDTLFCLLRRTTPLQETVVSSTTADTQYGCIHAIGLLTHMSST